MARRRYLLLTGLGLCLSARGLAAEGAGVARVSLADVGGAPGGGDAAAVFQAALARLPRRGGAVLHVPPGTWRFAATDGNAVLLDDFEALTIEGAGATLVFSGHCKPFVFSRCHRPVVRGLSIDWQRPPFSQGQVIRVGDGRLDADVSIDTGFAVDGSEPVSALGTYDRATGLMARGGLDAYDVVDHVALAASQTLRLAFKRPVPLQVGNTPRAAACNLRRQRLHFRALPGCVAGECHGPQCARHGGVCGSLHRGDSHRLAHRASAGQHAAYDHHGGRGALQRLQR